MSVKASDLYSLPSEQVAQLNALVQQIAIAETEIARAEAVGLDMAAERAQLAAFKSQRDLLLQHYGPGAARRWAQAARQPGG